MVTAELMADVVGFHLNRGVLATADRVEFPAAAELLRGCDRWQCSKGLETTRISVRMFRNAAALGVDAVLLARRLRRSVVPAQCPGVDGHGARGPFHHRPIGWMRGCPCCVARDFVSLHCRRADRADVARSGAGRKGRAAGRLRRSRFDGPGALAAADVQLSDPDGRRGRFTQCRHRGRDRLRRAVLLRPHPGVSTCGTLVQCADGSMS